MPRRAVAATAATVVATSAGFRLGAWSVRAPTSGPAKTTTSIAAAVRARATWNTLVLGDPDCEVEALDLRRRRCWPGRR